MDKFDKEKNAKNETYNIPITNGTGSENVNNGAYSVSASFAGYDSTTLDPASITVTADVTVYDFKISATGVLTLHVTEDGTSAGTPVENAVFVRCDSSGNPVGDNVTTDSTGTATISNVPYDSDGSISVYYKQLSSDSRHSFDDTLKSAIMTASSQTVEIANALYAQRVFNVTDANYPSLTITTGSLTLTSD